MNDFETTLDRIEDQLAACRRIPRALKYPCFLDRLRGAMFGHSTYASGTVDEVPAAMVHLNDKVAGILMDREFSIDQAREHMEIMKKDLEERMKQINAMTRPLKHLNEMECREQYRLQQEMKQIIALLPRIELLCKRADMVEKKYRTIILNRYRTHKAMFWSAARNRNAGLPADMPDNEMLIAYKGGNNETVHA